MNEWKKFKDQVKTTQIENLRINKDEIINLKVNLIKNWKN
jgi:hypothetical protein